MTTDDEKIQEIKQAFFEYAKQNELSAFDTSNYFVKQIIPDDLNESFFLWKSVIDDLIDSGIMVRDNGKWVIKNLEK